EYLWEPVLGGSIDTYDVPSLAFTDDPSVIVGNTNGEYPEGFATPGAVTSMSLTAGQEAFNTTGGTKSWDVYAEDDWQATPRLTLNLGTRYSMDLNTYGEADQPNARGYQALKGIASPYASKLPTTDMGDISPIIGFTYDLTGHGTQLLRGGFGMYYGQAFVNFVFGTLSQSTPTIYSNVYNETLSGVGAACNNCDVPGSGGIPLSSWKFGVDSGPVYTGAVPTSLTAGASSSIMDPDFRNAVSEQWNLGYTWGMTPTSALIVDYVHELGLHESRTININPYLDAQTGTRVLTAAFNAAGLPPLGAISDAQAANRSRYDSFSVEWRRRMTHNFSVDASYNLAQSLAWGGRAADNGNRPATLNPWNPVNFGPSDTDQRHRIVFSGIFNLPWGVNFAPILQWASAPPYAASAGSNIFGYGSGFTTPYAIVPNSDPTEYTAYATASPVFDPSTGFYTLPCLQNGTCHELAINSLRAQSFFDVDARFGKRLALRDWGSVNLFFQAFDLTNRTNFGSYNGNVRSSSFGLPQGYISGSGVTIPKSFRGEFGAEFTF
ncbi:MAG: hypothetical protein ACRD1Y_07355, partial [Terriglobales bacterium]